MNIWVSIGSINHFQLWKILIYFKFESDNSSAAIVETPKDPCIPSPCGPYSQCRVLDNHAVCSCQASYIGTPPSCRPECIITSDCAQDKACINQKCRDPCPGTCGISARCTVINHNAICSCSPGQVGDPFIRCILEESKNENITILYSIFSILCVFRTSCYSRTYKSLYSKPLRSLLRM